MAKRQQRQGEVLEVSIAPQGSELAQAHAAGATTLYLMDVVDFAEDTGGSLRLEDGDYVYDTVDTDAATVHLLSGLLTAREEGEQVLTLPLGETKLAQVEVDEQEEPLLVRIAHGLQDKMTDGVRDPEDQESVILEYVDGDWTVVDLVEEEPIIDAGFIDPDTVTSDVAADWGVVVQQQLDDQGTAINVDIAKIKNKDIVGTALDNAINDAVTKANAAQSTANTAQSSANGKNTITHSASAPGTAANTAGDTWFQYVDSTLAKIKAVWRGAGGSAWTQSALDTTVIPLIDIGVGTFGTLRGDRIDVTSLAAISQSQVTNLGTSLLSTQQTAQDAAISAGWLNTNPTFTAWASSTPDGFGVWNQTPTKETSIVRTAPNSARFTVATSTAQAGMQIKAGSPGTTQGLPNSDYYTIETDFYLVSGTLPGAGILIDWNGLTPSRSTVSLSTEFPSGVSTGKWYRLTKVVKKPAGATGTWGSTGGYLLANYTALGAAVKDIIFDKFAIRTSTTEEITAYEAPGQLSGLKTAWGMPTDSTLINGGIIATNTILSQSISIADYTDFVRDPYALNPTLWTMNTAGAWTFITGTGPTPAGTLTYLRLVKDTLGSGSGVITQTERMPCRPTDSYYLSSYWRRTGTTSTAGSVRIGFRWRDSAGTYISDTWASASSTTMNATFIPLTVTAGNATNVIPSNAATFEMVVQVDPAVTGGTYDVTDMHIRRRNGGELIVDGAVQATHFTGNSFIGVKMTAPLFETSATASRGIKIYSTDKSGFGSIVAYDSAVGSPTLGQPLFTLDGQTGSVTMRGSLTSGSTIAGAAITGSSFKTATGLDDIEIIPGGAFGPSSINFLTDNAQYDSTTPASLSCWDLVTTVGTVTYDTVSVTLQGPKMSGSSNTPKIVLANGRNRSTAAVQGGIDYYAAGVDGTNKATHDFYIDNVIVHYTDSTGITLQSGKGLGIGSASSGAPVGGLLATGNIITTAGVRSDGIGTQGSGSLQAYWNPANGFFQKASGSARKYKENIRAIGDALADLAIQVEPVTFTYIPGHDDEPGVLQTGFIADQAADLGGLDFWVIRDIETGEVENFRYDRWAVAQQAVLRKHAALIEALQAEVAELRAG